MASNPTNGNNSSGLYNFLNEKMYGLLSDEELKSFMKEYSNFLRKFLSSKYSDRYSKSDFIAISRKIYNKLSELIGEASNSNTLNTSIFTQIENAVNSYNGRPLKKNVFKTINESRLIKKNRYGKRDSLPSLFIEALIGLIVEYYLSEAGLDSLPHLSASSPHFVSYKKVKNTNNPNKINWNYEMEYIKGITLKDYLTNEDYNLDLSTLVNILIQVSEILGYLQLRCNFLHGDLNTSNIMLIPIEGAGGGFKVKIIDFGFSLIDTPYLDDERKPFILCSLKEHLDNLKITFRRNSNNINNESKQILNKIDLCHLMIFICKDLNKRDRNLSTILTNYFDLSSQDVRINIGEIHTHLRKVKVIPEFFTPVIFKAKIEELMRMNLSTLLNKDESSPVRRTRSMFNEGSNNGSSNGSNNSSNNKPFGIRRIPSFSPPKRRKSSNNNNNNNRPRGFGALNFGING